jgi:hypothetical protein
MRGAILADQSVSFPVMKNKLDRFIAILVSDPGVESATGTIGGGFGPGGAVNVADILPTPCVATRCWRMSTRISRTRACGPMSWSTARKPPA